MHRCSDVQYIQKNSKVSRISEHPNQVIKIKTFFKKVAEIKGKVAYLSTIQPFQITTTTTTINK